MNKLTLLLIIILLASNVYAQKITVIKLHYDNGDINLLNKTVKFGYYPDRRYQPDSGYRLQLVSKQNEILDDFYFKPPNVLFIDGTVNGELSGGMIILNDEEFALTLPYYGTEKTIKIYSPEEELINEFDIEEDTSQLRYFYVGFITVAVILALFMIFRKHKKNI